MLIMTVFVAGAAAGGFALVAWLNELDRRARVRQKRWRRGVDL